MAKAEDISVKNTKQEIIKAYQEVVEALKTKDKEALRPEAIKEEKQKKEVVTEVDAITKSDIAREVTSLKAHIAEVLAEVSVKLEAESIKYEQIKQAIVIKEQELKDIYGIETEAMSLAALIEAHKGKKESLLKEYETEKGNVNREISETRQTWQAEKEGFEAEMAERRQEQKKSRQREEEDYSYRIKRERELEQNRFNDEQEKLSKEMKIRKDEFDAQLLARQKELEVRERIVSENEKRMQDLEQKAASFEKELAKAVDREVAMSAERLTAEFKAREELLKQQMMGDKNVMKTRIEALEQVAEQQKTQIERLSQQVENSYRKVEDIAMKALDSEKRKAFVPVEYSIKEKTPQGEA